MLAVSEYINEIRSQLDSGHAKEHAYRPALQRLMRSFEDVEAINDPARSEHGAPDFIFQRKSHRDLILGYAEAKDIVGIKLDKVEDSEQMHRYSGYQNLYLTDYLEFRFFRDGEKYTTIRIGTVVDGKLVTQPDQYQRLINELQAFLELPPQQITSGSKLALIMGAKARRIRDDVLDYFEHREVSQDHHLPKLFKLMRTMLVRDLDYAKFSDMYAQTLVYGLFVARYTDPTSPTFSRSEARSLVPKTNPFLRHFFDHITGPDFDERLSWAVDELCEVFRISNVKELVHRHFGIDEERDPIIHFYEDFLKEYDPIIRKRMGAYYTPRAVVHYIIRKVDEILKTELGIADGISDSSKIVRNHRSYLNDPLTGMPTKKYKDERVEYHQVQFLDPAVGTATFLNELLNLVHHDFEEKGQIGRWPTYVRENLLPRLNGFEVMMAPYTIAHLKLGMTLEAAGVDNLNRRLGVYLTNTLEEGMPYQPDLLSFFGLAEAVTQESQEAGLIKNERPVMIVLGNPPYAAVSNNETEYANSLVQRYKVEPGGRQRLQEAKHWLNDDYVKFIAFSEDVIIRNETGILAMITNNGYFDDPTSRGMRWHLTKTFDKIYLLDLHGNANKKEKTPAGGRDENVFNIRQGVGIILAVKTSTDHAKPAEVYHADLWGTRKSKFSALNADDVEYTRVYPDPDFYFFKPRTTTGRSLYEQGISVKDLFLQDVTGIVTMGDDFAIDDDPQVVADRMKRLSTGGYDQESLSEKFTLGKNYPGFVLGNVGKWSFDPGKITKIRYRPFDIRYTYFDNRVLWRWREKIMKHFLEQENLGLITTRLQKEHPGALVTDTIIGHKALNAYDSNSVFPLYLFGPEGDRKPNFAPAQLKKLTQNISEKSNPEKVFDYIYGVLSSPVFLNRFGEFMRDAFPRIPIPASDEEFDAFAREGARIRMIHLNTEHLPYITTFPEAGSNKIDFVSFKEEEVWINQDQYFGGVTEEVWKRFIGGYQPAQRWLSDRSGKILNDEQIDYYQQLIAILSATGESMGRIAKIPAWWTEFGQSS
ncbi:N-6 DNA Methylase [Corynebacterium faecale]|uniref:type ISP restriction/modification enzyme n=1 Tax=Corynebacterium faecale TaxID=1758466 RepID=UPI0025B433AD|nr:type ISP restriction/modification enzyme [Corynebacterium faecale]WJY92133.1 N-6 DNA Methylase [Corynebacterium faecale]